MIICSCNVITEQDIKTSTKPCGAPAEKARDVFKSKNCQPKCGKCVQNIQNCFESGCEMKPWKIAWKDKATGAEDRWVIDAKTEKDARRLFKEQWRKTNFTPVPKILYVVR